MDEAAGPHRKQRCEPDICQHRRGSRGGQAIQWPRQPAGKCRWWSQRGRDRAPQWPEHGRQQHALNRRTSRLEVLHGHRCASNQLVPARDGPSGMGDRTPHFLPCRKRTHRYRDHHHHGRLGIAHDIQRHQSRPICLSENPCSTRRWPQDLSQRHVPCCRRIAGK